MADDTQVVVFDRDTAVAVSWCVRLLVAAGALLVLFTAQAGAQETPTAELTIVNDARDFILEPQAYRPINVAVGESKTYTVAAGTEFEIELEQRNGFLAMPGGFTRIWRSECVGSDAVTFSGNEEVSFGSGSFSGLLAAGDEVVCTVTAAPYGIFPTVTCLDGNGRIDLNVMNVDDEAHVFTVEVGTLSPRVRSVARYDWWRSPITGRPDGRIPAQIQRNGVTVWQQDLVVACDEEPAVTSPEVQLLITCRNGSNFVAWQFANPTAQPRGYVIEVRNKYAGYPPRPNRSTSAAAYGAAVRGASAVPNGSWIYTVKVDNVVLASGSFEATCDRYFSLNYDSRPYRDLTGDLTVLRLSRRGAVYSEFGRVVGLDGRLAVDANYEVELLGENQTPIDNAQLTMTCNEAADGYFTLEGGTFSGSLPEYTNGSCTIVATPLAGS